MESSKLQIQNSNPKIKERLYIIIYKYVTTKYGKLVHHYYSNIVSKD